MRDRRRVEKPKKPKEPRLTNKEKGLVLLHVWVTPEMKKMFQAYIHKWRIERHMDAVRMADYKRSIVNGKKK